MDQHASAPEEGGFLRYRGLGDPARHATLDKRPVTRANGLPFSNKLYQVVARCDDRLTLIERRTAKAPFQHMRCGNSLVSTLDLGWRGGLFTCRDNGLFEPATVLPVCDGYPPSTSANATFYGRPIVALADAGFDDARVPPDLRCWMPATSAMQSGAIINVGAAMA